MKPLFLSRGRCPSRWTGLALAAFLFLGWCPFAWCQTDPPGVADPSADRPEFQFNVQLGSESGVATFVPEKWGSLRLSILNGRSEPRDLLCSTYFDKDSGLQYGRRVWLPAQSLLRIDHPVLIPKCDPRKGRNLELHSLVFDSTSSHESLVRSEGGQLRHDGALIVTHDTRNTAIIDKPSRAADTTPDDVADLIAACRVELELNKSHTLLGDAFLPSEETSLEALDHIVVVDSRIVKDAAATAALRRWLHGGGHLWVMLDRVDPVVLEMLLGDDFTGFVIDRVGLTSVRIDEAAVESSTKGTVSETMVFDDPVDLVRMAVGNINVTHTVNGWPAAMTIPCGDGKLLITTLGARGWMKPRPENAPKPANPQMVSANRPLAPMADLADEFFRLRDVDLLPPEAIAPQVREYIGYSILSWRLIVGTLLGFSAGFVAVGIWLYRIGRLEQICWVGSVLALGVSMFLLRAGWTNRQGIPATMASVQLVQTIRGTDDLRSEGLVAIYHPEGSESPITATRGGRMKPDMTGLEQTSRRMVTTDLGTYHWENLDQPAGVRSTPFEQSEGISERMAASVTFDSQGISGKYVGGLAPGNDAILATRDGRLGLTLKGDGTFVARSDEVFEKDQFLSAGLLSDEQDRRRRTLKELLDNPKRPDYPGRPQLMFWSGPWDNGFQFGEGLRSEGAALVAVPLLIDRPTNGTEIMIPSPFLSYVNRRSPDGTRPSAMWNSIKKQWQERSTPGVSWLSFQIPRELVPVVAKRARIDLKVSGPIGRVEILGIKGGNVVELKTLVNPVGSVAIEITDAEALPIDDEGRLALGLSAGNADGPEPAQTRTDDAPSESTQQTTSSIDQTAKANYWRIESLALQLWAQITEPTTKD